MWLASWGGSLPGQLRYSPRTGPVVLVARHYCNFERQYTLQAVIQSSAADSLQEAYIVQKEKETYFNLQG